MGAALAIRGATVNRLRIRCVGRDASDARLRLPTALEAALSHPPGLPPAAILCIRQLVDPRPRSVAMHSGAPPPSRWTDAVAETLRDLARRAYPASREVPAHADAVLFADQTELIACLAEDWCAGCVASRWWWKVLLHDVADPRAVVQAWLASPTHVASALDQLARRGTAVAFAARLAPSEARDLLRAVQSAHALPAPCVSGDAGSTPDQRASADIPVSAPAPDRTSAPAPVMSGAVAITAPWAHSAPEAEHDALQVDQRTFLGVALTAYRIPHVARSSAFATRYLEWRRRATVPITGASAAAPVSHPKHRVLQNDACRPPLVVSSPLPTAETKAVTRAAPGVPQVSDRAVVPPIVLHVGERTTSRLVVSSAPAPPKSPSSSLGGTSIVTSAGARVIETRFGGVLYLLNFALFLGLYGDFTTPARLGISLPIWDFIVLLGRCLCGRRLCRDPLWALAADLAGRDVRQTPGAPDGVFWGTWMEAFVPRAQARLASALGTRTRRETSRVLCARPARVHVTSSRIDVMFSLASLPIEVRLSGLDRDPGWIPAAGRMVAFHYD